MAFHLQHENASFWKQISKWKILKMYHCCLCKLFLFIVKIILLMLKKTAVVYMILPWRHSTNILGFTDWTLKK